MKKVTKTIIFVVMFIIIMPIIIVFIIFFISIDDWYTIKKFGNNYELVIVSRNNNEIEYRIHKKTYNVIRESILEYDFDKRWIIAKSKKYNYPMELMLSDDGNYYYYARPSKPDSVTINYWIIDKSIPINLNDSNTFERIPDEDGFYEIVKSGLAGPLDSLSFIKELEKRKVDLKFSN
ncbi:hypothetical protein AGMMS50262_06450 [Bacteroidia bacterium]|nr:hypothetical protein AGMMS50262_06450 [Bacteroidia bacterium]